MRELTTEIEIDAPAARVWQLLVGFEDYPGWNPFITSVAGEAREGESLRARVGGLPFRPVVLKVEPERELRWLGRLVLPGVFDGEHRFEIDPLGDSRVRFRQSERFTGVLVPLFWLFMRGATGRGFEAMNAALKRAAETKAAG